MMDVRKKILAEYDKYSEEKKSNPLMYKPLSLNTFTTYAALFKDFWQNMIDLKYEFGGIHMKFCFENGATASVVNNQLSGYDWKLMSPVIRTDDSFKSHLTDVEATGILLNIKQGEYIY
jgi:hypothetical protein